MIGLPGHELELVHAPVGVDHQVGFEVYGVGFDDHVGRGRGPLPDIRRQDAPSVPVPDVHPGHDLARLQGHITNPKRRADDADLGRAEGEYDRAILAATGLIDVLMDAVVAEQLEGVFVVTA